MKTIRIDLEKEEKLGKEFLAFKKYGLTRKVEKPLKDGRLIESYQYYNKKTDEAFEVFVRSSGELNENTPTNFEAYESQTYVTDKNGDVRNNIVMMILLVTLHGYRAKKLSIDPIIGDVAIDLFNIAKNKFSELQKYEVFKVGKLIIFKRN